ncbi:hypothetical protein BDW22DRAFT_1431972 [Trametopsis cervina]|nr:hypothetical protein BDW22DRAFT_1431972 [Trametopsis cervina]
MAATHLHTIANAQSQSSSQLNPTQRRPMVSKQRFAADLSRCLYDFVVQLLPTPEELAIKEDVRKLLERLIRTIEPDSRLLSFGSTANGFSLRNSDMDLCCLIDSEDRLPATALVNMLGDLFARETKFHIKPLPHARIPIVKLSLDPKPGLPFGIACDIGFENRLALENTRLLMCYAMIDPARVRTMVLFLKVWCKRRKINSPYKGTLSSYGYVLLVIYFLVHVKNPPVLPNLQQMPPMRPISPEETHLNGYNVWFFDDINLLRERWQSSNTESVAELLLDFFRFYSKDFLYNTSVASIRAGLLSKESKGWHNDPDKGTARERNRLCIEDPFETDFNVSRCVTRDGLYTIRGEFMRASKILAARPERAVVALAQLCEERKDEELLHASPSWSQFAPPRLSPVPKAAQTPYAIGSNPMRPSGAPEPDRLSPPEVHHVPSTVPPTPVRITAAHPEHMGPKRSKWTSPPPPEAPEADRSAFEDRLGHSLTIATSSTDARQREPDGTWSSANSEILTDEDDIRSIADSEDARSVRSFTEERGLHRPMRQATMQSSQYWNRAAVNDPSNSHQRMRTENSAAEGGITEQRWSSKQRGRPAAKVPYFNSDAGPSPSQPRSRQDNFVPPPRMEPPRRSTSGPAGPPRPFNRYSISALPTIVTPISVYPSRTQMLPQSPQHSQHRTDGVFYETTPLRERMARALGAEPSPPIVSRLPNLGRLEGNPRFDSTLPQSRIIPRHIHTPDSGTISPLSTTPSQANVSLPYTRLTSHSHSHSQSTIIAPTPPPSGRFPSSDISPPYSRPSSQSRSTSPSPPRSKERPSDSRSRGYLNTRTDQSRSFSPSASVSSASGSPPMSCASSQYALSISPVSTSPPSPTHNESFEQPLVKLDSSTLETVDQSARMDSKAHKAAGEIQPHGALIANEDDPSSIS